MNGPIDLAKRATLGALGETESARSAFDNSTGLCGWAISEPQIAHILAALEQLTNGQDASIDELRSLRARVAALESVHP